MSYELISQAFCATGSSTEYGSLICSVMSQLVRSVHSFLARSLTWKYSVNHNSVNQQNHPRLDPIKFLRPSQYFRPQDGFQLWTVEVHYGEVMTLQLHSNSHGTACSVLVAYHRTDRAAIKQRFIRLIGDSENSLLRVSCSLSAKVRRDPFVEYSPSWEIRLSSQKFPKEIKAILLFSVIFLLLPCSAPLSSSPQVVSFLRAALL